MPLAYYATTNTGHRKARVEVYADTREQAVQMVFERDPEASQCRSEYAFYDPWAEAVRPNGMNVQWHSRPANHASTEASHRRKAGRKRCPKVAAPEGPGCEASHPGRLVQTPQPSDEIGNLAHDLRV